MPISVSAVMFAWNEAEHLDGVVRETLRALADYTDAFELVLVDDGSTDETPAIAAALAAEHGDRLVVITHPENRGIGEAVHTAYDHLRASSTGSGRAATEYVCILPADGQIRAADYVPLFEAAESRNADLVLGRYRQRGQVDGLTRVVLSRGLRLMMWAALGVGRHIDSAYVFRRRWLDEVPLTTRTFFVNLELPIRIIRATSRGRGEVVDVPIDVHPRISGQSKVVKAGRIARVGRDVMKLRVQLWRERGLGVSRRDRQGGKGRQGSDG